MKRALPHTPPSAQRRRLLSRLAVAAGGTALLPLTGCGFQLRRGYNMAFRTIQLSGFVGTSPLATELARALEASGVDVLESSLQAKQAASSASVPVTHIEFNALQDTRDSVVSAKTAFGQVRTITARSILRFEVKRSDGSVLLPASDVVLVRDLSYNERDALAKQDESDALNRAMQTDIVNQVMRRLSAIRAEQLRAPAPQEPTLPPAAPPASAVR